VVVGSSGVVNFYAPYNEAFLAEFKNVFNVHDRHWNPDRKIWQIKQEGIAALIEVMQKYYNKIEGLDALIESPFDVLKVTPDAPVKLVRMAAKVLRSEYHPDHINFGNFQEKFPEAQSLEEAVGMATDHLQEIGEAEKLILEIKASEEEE
jgi:hypothetical protein